MLKECFFFLYKLNFFHIYNLNSVSVHLQMIVFIKMISRDTIPDHTRYYTVMDAITKMPGRPSGRSTRHR